MGGQETRVEQYINKIKNNKILAIIIVTGTVLLVVLGFVSNVRQFVDTTFRSPPSDFTKEEVSFGQAQGVFFFPPVATNLEGYHPAWSSNGEAIVYLTDSLTEEKGTDVFISTDLGRSSQLLMTTKTKAYFPSFSSDNRFISLITDLDPYSHRHWVKGHLKLYDTKTDTIRHVTSQRQRMLFSMNYQVNYDWDPKRNRVAFIVADVDSDEQYLAVYNISKSRIQKYFAEKGGWHPQWSPDGKRVGFVSGGGGSHNLLLVDLESNGVNRIDGVNIQSYFQWLTNTKIIFPTAGAGAYRIATYDIDNRKLGYLSKYEFYTDPVLSKNRKLLVYRNQVRETNESWRHDLYVQDLNTMETKKICELPGNPFYMDLFVQISPDEEKATFSYKNEIVIVQFAQ